MRGCVLGGHEPACAPPRMRARPARARVWCRSPLRRTRPAPRRAPAALAPRQSSPSCTWTHGHTGLQTGQHAVADRHPYDCGRWLHGDRIVPVGSHLRDWAHPGAEALVSGAMPHWAVSAAFGADAPMAGTCTGCEQARGGDGGGDGDGAGCAMDVRRRRGGERGCKWRAGSPRRRTRCRRRPPSIGSAARRPASARGRR